jgi:hypothetical protein
MPPQTGLGHFMIQILQRCRAYGAKVLASTFGGGEGAKSPRWDRLDKDDVKIRSLRSFAAIIFVETL